MRDAAASVHVPTRHARAHVQPASPIDTDEHVLEISDRGSLHRLFLHGTAAGLEALLEGALRQVRVDSYAEQAPQLLAWLAVVEPVHLDDEGEWACAYCAGPDRRGGFMPGADSAQWRRTGEFVVEHEEDDCPWLLAAQWLTANTARVAEAQREEFVDPSHASRERADG